MSNRVLLVEGQNDKHFVQHISQISNFEVINAGGINNLLKDIRPRVVEPGRMVVGILVDANDHIAQRWEQLSASLKGAAVELPQNPDPDGAIVLGLPDGVPRRPRIGVWLMPDNHSAGELEDFVEKMIPEDDPAWPCASDYIKCIPEEQRSFKEGKLLRAQIHAWLATRKIPGRIGAAISAADLRTNGELAQRFVGWLGRLYR